MSIQTPSQFLRAFFGAYSEAPVFLVSLPNTDEREGQAGPKEVLTRDPATIDGFVQRWDRKGRGLYFCVGTIREGAMPNKPGGSRRIKENIAEIVTAHAEVDAKGIEISLDEVIEAVWNLPHPPSITVRSGNGLHLYWLLSEGIAADPDTIARIEMLNAQLSDLVGGDHVQDVTRLLRVPGTHNTKKGAWTEVQVVESKFEPRHEIADLEEMVAMLSPVVRRKVVEGAKAADINPFLRVAAQAGYKPPLDVEQMLANMGPGNMHDTVLRVGASLLNKGSDEDEVVGVLMPELARVHKTGGSPYTERQAQQDERKIRGQCRDWARKNPAHNVRALPRAAAQDAAITGGRQRDLRDPELVAYEGERADIQLGLAEEAAAPTADGTNVVPFAAKAGKKEPKPRQKSEGPSAAQVASMVSDGVVEAMREDGRDMVHSEGDTFLYGEGVWCGAGPTEHQFLKIQIQRACEAMGFRGDVRAANAALKLLLESPALYMPVVPWNTGAHLALGNGMIDLRTRRFGSWAADAWCRMKINTPYEPRATCPIFLKFLESAFADRDPEERTKIILLLQDFFGSMLAVSTLHREQRKALMLFGPSRSGKTVLSSIARLLIGSRIASPSIADIGNDFGLQLLAAANAWVRDDAVSEGDRIDPARFKVLVTGEALEINRKNQAPVTFSCNIPILLTTNAMPKAKDSSDALYNRCLVVDMRSVVEEEDSLAAKAALGIPADADVARYIGEHEAPGILNWALDGLDRLRERGRFDIPKSVKAAIESFKATNNPVAEWVTSCVEFDPDYMVSRSDLRCSFHGWMKEENGDEAKAWGGKYFMDRLRSFQHRGLDVEGGKDGHGERFVYGLRLTDEGKRLWRDHRASPLKSGCEGSSTADHDINRARSGSSAKPEPKTEF